MKHFLGEAHYIKKEVKCPFCDYPNDSASGLDNNSKPTSGDYAICISCASPLVYTDTLDLRPMTNKEFGKLHPENREQIELAMRTIKLADRSRFVP